MVRSVVKAQAARKPRSSSPTARRTTSRESFQSAAECIGPAVAGMSLFALTRGQWSMIDAVLHVLDCVGPSKVSLWTWTVAEYEVQVLTRLRLDHRITDGRLVIDYGARNKNAGIIAEWKSTFGRESVRYVRNHAKLARIESADGLCFLLRGSMNLNFNPRFEQFDITEGGADFDLVTEIEDELPVLADDCSCAEVLAASKMSDAFDLDTLQVFGEVKVWAK